jgi:hypothetical protein
MIAVRERLIMKIKGQLANMLTDMDMETHADYAVQEGNVNVLYVVLRKTLYGLLQALLLFYKESRKDLEEIGYKVNSYIFCDPNRFIQAKKTDYNLVC